MAKQDSPRGGKRHPKLRSDVRSSSPRLRLILNTGAEADSWNSKFAGSSLVIERRVCAPGWYAYPSCARHLEHECAEH